MACWIFYDKIKFVLGSQEFEQIPQIVQVEVVE
jgi:hypothetical protein